MGKKIGTQRRGKGKNRYTSPSHKYKYDAKYRKEENVTGTITKLYNEPSKTGLVMIVRWDDDVITGMLAPEGLCVGMKIELGSVKPEIGNVLSLSNIPDGYPVFNVENCYYDGGKVIRASGSTGFIVGRRNNKVLVKLPSKTVKMFAENCRATIGIVAGGGRTEKPLYKAGKAYHKNKARAARYPRVRGVAMNPVAHPHGGSQHHAGKPTTVSRDTSPGRKVGHIAARRTGRRKKK